MGWAVLAGFAAWRRIQSCGSECTSCRTGWEEWRKPFPGNICCPWWVEKQWASLILSPLLWQMPVTKRPRKSSSDLDQGSPSVTEEENSETSSESEKNSDQVRGFGDAVAGWWAEHPCGSGAEAGGNLTGFTLRWHHSISPHICVFLQDFTPEKKPVARAPRRMPAAGRKKKVKDS